MKKKSLIFSVLILPLIPGCEITYTKIDFLMGSYANEIMDIDEETLYSKAFTSHDSFFLVTHSGDSCTCYNDFRYVLKTFNDKRKEDGKEYLPFYSIDLNNLANYNSEQLGIDPIYSGYIDFYVVIDGLVEAKYSKGAKIDYEMFENVDKFAQVVNQHIGSEPKKNYYTVSYNYLNANLINNNDNSEFALLTIRSGCGDCSYAIPHVINPWMKENELRIPLLVVDIQQFKRVKTEYAAVKNSLKLTSDASPEYGYGEGVVPTYQYWKNGELCDAGVYANDSVKVNNYPDEYEVTSCYFDGTRNLKYTNENIVGKIEELNLSDFSYFNNETSEYNCYIPIEIEATIHDSILKQFLTYYCKK